MSKIAENLANIQKEVEVYAQKSSRKPTDIQLIAVSKTFPNEAIEAAYYAGQRHFGENRPQELKEKQAYFAAKPEFSEIKWHLIGQLQKNKVKYIAPFVYLIHSVDSEELMREIQKQASKNQRTIAVLLQINISNEIQKSGMEEQEAIELLQKIADFPNVEVKGLMGMASFTDDTTLIQSQFHRLSQFLQQLSSLFPSMNLTALSMGMSGDFPIAIQEGATYVRVGTAIFNERMYE